MQEKFGANSRQTNDLKNHCGPKRPGVKSKWRSNSEKHQCWEVPQARKCMHPYIGGNKKQPKSTPQSEW